MAKFMPNLSEESLPDTDLEDIEIDLPEEEFGELYAKVFRRIHRFHQPLVHNEQEKQVIDATVAVFLKHLYLLQEYVLREITEDEEPDLNTLHRELAALRHQAFQWDYGENAIGRSAHIVTTFRNMFFGDMAALHFLADELVEEHWGRGTDVEVVVKLAVRVPVPKKKAKSFVLRCASKPFLSRKNYEPLVTDLTVRKLTKPTTEEEEE